MQALKTLIDDSLKMCNGNQSELARKLGVSTSLMNAIIKGQRSLTWPHAALMAEMTGSNIEEAIRAALIAETPMLKNGAKLREILGKGLAGGAVAMLAFSSNAAPTDSTEIIKNDSAIVYKDIHRIYQKLLCKIQKIVGEFLLRKNRALALRVEPAPSLTWL